MDIRNDGDARAVLARDKYFSLRPKPLERWLWQQGIPQTAERVFWLHWEAGMRRGDWCSELSLKEVARECAVDTSTVTRAYQVLKRLGAVRREEPGRDPLDPFRQAIAITEVLIPRELLVTLSRYPNRPKASPENLPRQMPPLGPQTASSIPHAAALPPKDAPKPSNLSRAQSQALMAKLSTSEKAAFYQASQNRRTSMAFDAETALAADERGAVLQILTGISTSVPTRPAAAPAASPRSSSAAAHRPAASRKLSPLAAARVRNAVLQQAAPAAAPELFREVLWSMEQGALRRFEAAMALNIALKKIREGAWTRPNRLPPNWLADACPEACTAA